MSDECDHDWQLTETGYVRKWITEYDQENKTVIAYWGGSEDFSDGGNGDEHLECLICGSAEPLPDEWEIDYR